MKGQLSQRSFGEIISELYRSRATGILTINYEKQTKAIFIEDGNPVFAISNALEDQLSGFLIKQGKLTADQLSKFGSIANSMQLAQKISDSGIIEAEELSGHLQQLILNIVTSTFEWRVGDFTFEKKDRARLTSTVKLDQRAPEIILIGARKASDGAIRARLSGDGITIKPVSNVLELLGEMPLDSTEGFVLSRVFEPTDLQDILSLTGLPEEQVLRALYVLSATGLIKIEISQTARQTFVPSQTQSKTEQSSPEPPHAPAEEEFNEAKFSQEVTRMLAFFATADLYEVLGVTRRASEAEIKRSYYKLAKKYHPDRVHKSNDPDLKSELEKAFAKISEAYEKLSDPDERKMYNDRIRGKPERPITPPPQPPPQPKPVPPPEPEPKPVYRSTAPPPAQPISSPPKRPTGQYAAVSQPQPSPPISAQPQTAPQTAPPTRPAAQPARPTAQPMRPTAQPASPVASANPSGALKAEPASGNQTASASAVPAEKSDKTPDMAEINYVQGKQAFDRKDFARAAYLLREAVNLNGENKAYRQQLVTVLMRNQKWYKEAEEHLIELAKVEPFNSNHHSMLGQIYMESGQHSRAEAKFKEALSIDSQNRSARKELKGMKAAGLTDAAKAAAIADGKILSKFKALPPQLQYALYGIVILLIIFIIYTQLG